MTSSQFEYCAHFGIMSTNEIIHGIECDISEVIRTNCDGRKEG